MSTQELGPCDIITPPLRIAYAHGLFEARVSKDAEPGAKPKFTAVLLIPPDVSLEPFVAAVKAAMMKSWNKLVPLPASKNPIKDAAEKADKEGFDEGWHYINVSATRQPAVVDRALNPILDKSIVYSGCWVRAHINTYATNHPKNPHRVSFGVNSVQFVKDGERLGSQALPPEAVFKPLDVAKTAAKGKAAPADDLDSMFS